MNKKVVQKPRKKRTVSIPEYTLAEELVNSISHGVGAGLAIAALVLCVVKASSGHAIVAAVLYGALMITLYTISCIYHALSPKVKGKKVLRVIDHANVFLMEAGTYMPICLALFFGTWYGWVTFGIVWAVTALAVVLSSIDVDKYQMVGVACNLFLGWGSLLLLPWLIPAVGAGGLAFLIGGGAVYSLGAGLYVIGKKRKWFHSIFHFFVLAGSILHFFFVYLYCL